jgi:hypothetical protein
MRQMSIIAHQSHAVPPRRTFVTPVHVDALLVRPMKPKTRRFKQVFEATDIPTSTQDVANHV